ncbi:MAG TPA: hypothetical protein DEB39_02785 [Planctomycetaceae bacterium]|nr:hypothetical protein [Planctomycetaceae bacterium]
MSHKELIQDAAENHTGHRATTLDHPVRVDEEKPASEQRIVDFSDNAEAYFDRERWRAVGDDVKRYPDKQSRGYLRAAGLSPFSVAILAVVALVAGIAGVLAINILPSVRFFPPSTYRKPGFRSIPVQWIGYHQTAAFSVGISRGSCFCADASKRLFIGYDRQVSVFSSQGIRLGTFPVSGFPQAILLSEKDSLFQGRFLVAFQDHIEVYTLNDDLTAVLVARWKPFEGSPNISSLALGPDALYVGDAGGKVVYKCAANGNILKRIGSPPSESRLPFSRNRFSDKDSPDESEERDNLFPGFVILAVPSLSVSVSPETGLLYAANPGRHRVEAFTRDGVWEPSLSWGDSSSAGFVGFCGCCNPTGIQVLPDGSILTVEKSINRIKIYKPNGKLDTVVAGSETLDRLPQGIVERGRRDIQRNLLPGASQSPVLVSPQGDQVFVFDPVFQLVRVFDRIAER